MAERIVMFLCIVLSFEGSKLRLAHPESQESKRTKTSKGLSLYSISAMISQDNNVPWLGKISIERLSQKGEIRKENIPRCQVPSFCGWISDAVASIDQENKWFAARGCFATLLIFDLIQQLVTHPRFCTSFGNCDPEWLL